MKHRIARLVKDGLYRESIALYSNLLSSSSPTKHTFPYLLKACAELQAVTHGQMLHAHLIRTGHDTSKHTTTDLTNMYMKLQLVESAAKLFDEIPHPGVSIVNVVISGFAQNGFFQEGFRVFKTFGVCHLRLDSVTIASVAAPCRNVVNGVQVHCLAVKIGVERDCYAATSITTMYLNSGELGFATRLFEWIENKNVVCYNAYLSGLVQNGVVEVVFHVFTEMRGQFYEKPDAVTMICVLSASANGKCIRFGQQLHGLIVKLQLDHETNVGTGLVDMYSKCGSGQYAYEVFVEMGSNRNLITWNSMIAGMMLNGQSEKAIDLFVKLEQEGFNPDLATWNSMINGFVQLGKGDEAFLFFKKMISCNITPNLRCITSLLAACSSLSLLQYGKQIHGFVTRFEIAGDEFFAAAIIDMYMKCGQPFLARNIFNRLDRRPNDPAVWNAMISGYGRNGESEAAFDIFHQMVEQKIKPNSVTLGCLLTVCTHTGQVEDGFQIFRKMTVEYGLEPKLEHLNVLIDLLSRSGRLEEAYKLLKVTHEASASAFASLLGACKNYSDSTVGEEMARRISEIDPENPIPFVILSNIYAGQENWKDVAKIRKLLDKKRFKKLPGLSSPEAT